MLLATYLIRRLLANLAFGIGLFAALAFAFELVSGIGALAVGKPGGEQAILAYVGARLPFMMIVIFPVAMLFSCVMTYTRLCSDGEYLAIRVAGCGVLGVVGPALAVAVACAGISYGLCARLVPLGMRQAENVRQGLRGVPVSLTGAVLPPTLVDGMERRCYIAAVDAAAQEMRGVVLQYLRGKHLVRETFVESVDVHAMRWLLRGIRDQEFDEAGRPVRQSLVRYAWLPPDASLGLQGDTRPNLQIDEMTNEQLLDQIRLSGFVYRSPQEKARLAVAWYQRTSMPFACLAFTLVAAPLALRRYKAHVSYGAGVSLVFVLAYYMALTSAARAAERSVIDPWLAAWLPNLILIAVGTFLLYRRSRS